MPRDDLIRLRRGRTQQWVLTNPVLADGEPGYDHETRVFKVGDGVTPWLDLEPLAGSTPGPKGDPGEDGEDGLPGLPGPAGPPGPVPAVVFTVMVPTAEWVLVHDLGRLAVDVVTLDANGDEVIGDVVYDDPSTARVLWYNAMTGTATVSL